MSDDALAASTAHFVKDMGVLLIGVDGELQWLDAETLEPRSDSFRPFPSPITRSIVIEDSLIGFWVEHDILAARMACIPLDRVFAQGVNKSTVRASMHPGSEYDGPVDVAGARWSHVLDAEPLGLTELAGGIAFALWKRGVYCIGLDAEEIWRRPQMGWMELEGIPRGEEISGMHEVGDELYLWSRAGGWARLSADEGETLEMGTIEAPASITDTFHSPEGGWLLCTNRGHLLRFKDPIGDEITVVDVGGPVSAALWDEEDRSWRMCGWREDLIWSDEGMMRFERDELGVQILQQGKNWQILENLGNWSEFKKK